MRKTEILELLKNAQIVEKMKESKSFGHTANVQMKCRSLNGREAIFFDTGRHVISDTLAGELTRAVAELFGDSLTIIGTNVVSPKEANTTVQIEYRINAQEYDFAKVSEFFEDVSSPKDIQELVNNAKSHLWNIQQQMGADAAMCLDDFSMIVGALTTLSDLMDMVEVKDEAADGE